MSQLLVSQETASVDWLQEKYYSLEFHIFDTSWHMPAIGRNGQIECQVKRIQNVRVFNFVQSIQCRQLCRY